MRARTKRILTGIAIGVVALFGVAQLIPYGRDHTNPPVVREPAWDSPRTRELAVRACFDCHSNETHWPWYAHVAPTSWLLQSHVDEGRQVLNFSEWTRPYEEAGEAAETVLDGTMPLDSYLLLHPRARLSAAEKKQLADGLRATLGTSGDEEEEAD
jgi:hypothetical protein